MEVQFFDKRVKNFIKDLEFTTSAKVFRTIELLEKFGNNLGMPHSKHIGGGLFELRVRGQQEVRFLYAFYKGAAVLLNGFLKKSQKIPKNEIETARQKLSTLDIL